jgi:hypothetical protein
VQVAPRFANLQAGVDAEMAQALALIKGWRAASP